MDEFHRGRFPSVDHTNIAAGNPAAGRPHGSFHNAYASGAAPWDIGEPQPEIIAQEEACTFGDRVIEVGCGTGDNAIFLASRGHDVIGIDSAQIAIDAAQRKAADAEVTATFVIGDVLDVLSGIEGAPFDSALDVGFFHALDDEQRIAFAHRLASVLVPGGTYVMLCFSERVPGEWGPRRVSEAEIAETFSAPWFRIREIRPAELISAVPEMPIVDANLAIVERA